MSLHRAGLKMFLKQPVESDADFFVRLFHGWIQDQSLEDHLLVDVHNYNHMHEGPGILLVAHQAHFHLNLESRPPFFLYLRKKTAQTGPVTFPGLFLSGLRAAVQLQAARAPEGGELFDQTQFQIVAADRLRFPGGREGSKLLGQALRDSLDRFLDTFHFEIEETDGDPRGRATVTVRAKGDREPGLEAMIESLEGLKVS